MKTLRQELIDFVEFADKVYWSENEHTEYKNIIELYLKSINYELSEPEADGCNKQTQELCCCTVTRETPLINDRFICSICNKPYEKHWELNNLMTPIVNYFSMYKELDNPQNKSKINGIIKLIKQERKVVHEVMPKILEILSSNERESVGKHEAKKKPYIQSYSPVNKLSKNPPKIRCNRSSK